MTVKELRSYFNKNVDEMTKLEQFTLSLCDSKGKLSELAIIMIQKEEMLETQSFCDYKCENDVQSMYPGKDFRSQNELKTREILNNNWSITNGVDHQLIIETVLSYIFKSEVQIRKRVHKIRDAAEKIDYSVVLKPHSIYDIPDYYPDELRILFEYGYR
eukprot:UN00260